MVESQQFPELEKTLLRRGADKSRGELAQWLAAQARAGRIAIDDADSAAHILMNMIFSIAGPNSRRQLAWPDARKRRDHIRRCVAIFLGGVVPRG